MRQADPNASFLLKNMVNTGRVGQEQTGMAWARHKSKGESHFSVLPLPLSFARSRESKGCPNSHFDRGVGLRARGRYPLKPSIFASLLETKGYPEHTAQPATMSARSSRESHFRLK